jgi:hypothetical protein
VSDEDTRPSTHRLSGLSRNNTDYLHSGPRGRSSEAIRVCLVPRTATSMRTEDGQIEIVLSLTSPLLDAIGLDPVRGVSRAPGPFLASV